MVANFLGIRFVQKWDSPGTRVDDVIRLLTGNRWIRRLSTGVVNKLDAEKLLPFIMKQTEPNECDEEDPHTRAAYDEDALEDDVTHVVYGHTHVPMVRPLNSEAIYVNTGTWRDRVCKTPPFHTPRDFVALRQMAFAAFYNETEEPRTPGADSTRFDMWVGTRGKRWQQAAGQSSVD